MLEEPAFANRLEAGELLASRLGKYRGEKPVVLAIPRGAVPMARVIAEALGGELDVALVHKLRAPFQEEFAIGAVDEGGEVHLGDVIERYGIGRAYVEDEVQRQLTTLRRRRELYTPGRGRVALTGRTVIVVDDGVATGWTMVAALRSARAERPAKLVAATAVAPPDAVARMERQADEVVCLETPETFYAVGQFFLDFHEVTDDEVVQVLASASQTTGPTVGE